MQSLDAWLRSLGLERYVDVFMRNDVDLQSVELLSDSDLRDLGLTLGQWRKLQQAVARRAPNTPSPNLSVIESVAVHPRAEHHQHTVSHQPIEGARWWRKTANAGGRRICPAYVSNRRSRVALPQSSGPAAAADSTSSAANRLDRSKRVRQSPLHDCGRAMANAEKLSIGSCLFMTGSRRTLTLKI